MYGLAVTYVHQLVILLVPGFTLQASVTSLHGLSKELANVGDTPVPGAHRSNCVINGIFPSLPGHGSSGQMQTKYWQGLDGSGRNWPATEQPN